jgi:hypothetical protein
MAITDRPRADADTQTNISEHNHSAKLSGQSGFTERPLILEIV